MKIKPTISVAVFLMTCSLGGCGVDGKTGSGEAGEAKNASVGWPVYGGGEKNDRYSPMTQINRSNVCKLETAWTYDTGEISEGSGLQTNPLVIGRVLYGYTPSQKVVALDATNGNRLWQFDSGTASDQPIRGLAYWSDGKESRLMASVGHFLYALNPNTGKPIETFGEGGRIDIRKNLRGNYQDQSIGISTPGIIYKNLYILGGGVQSETLPTPPGDVRAYDVLSGELRWSFHTIPHPGEPGHETWPEDAWKYSGGANAWGGASLDVERGIVYVATGSAASDMYGGDRIGNNLYANTLLALDANTGKRIWHFQGVHHDIWDLDFPSAPTLVTVIRDGKPVDAVAQPSKQGYLYLLDRATGEPLFPIEEQPYQASTVPGEVTSPTQPRPLLPEPFVRQRLTEDMLTKRTPEANAYAVEKFRTFQSEGMFVPWRLDKETVKFPGFDGGAEWGGAAVDVQHQIIYINANEMAWTGGLAKVEKSSPGEETYLKSCSVCHGRDRQGSAGFPSLAGIGNRLTVQEIEAVLRNGKGRMPSFAWLFNDESNRAEVVPDLLAYLNNGNKGSSSHTKSGSEKSEKDEYSFTGYNMFKDQDGYPAIAPPWGTLNAIDLNTGKYVWKIPLGEYPELAAKGIKNTGSMNYGGPVATAGGVLFIAATSFDHKIRAFDSSNGDLLWQTTMSGAGRATPATYMVDGRQYVVIATGAVRFFPSQKPLKGSYTAFALPDRAQSTSGDQGCPAIE